MNYPLLAIAGHTIQVLGDQHFGRKFINGVPLHRRGDRELMITKQFQDHMRNLPETLTIHVNMGDVFDKEVVHPNFVAMVAEEYEAACRRCPETLFVLIRGNHDAGKDLEQVSSFDLLAAIVKAYGVVVVRDEPYVSGGYLFVPWQNQRSTAELVERYKDFEFDAVFGHWDVVNPTDNSNMVPLDTLKSKLFITGHDHLRRDVGNIRVVGSMQPYAHGEDWTGQIYRTLTLKELETVSKDQCIRLILAEGEELPTDIDCLQITAMRQRKGEEDKMDVGFEGLDMQALWDSTFAELGVGKELTNTLMTKYRER